MTVSNSTMDEFKNFLQQSGVSETYFNIYLDGFILNLVIVIYFLFFFSHSIHRSLLPGCSEDTLNPKYVSLLCFLFFLKGLWSSMPLYNLLRLIMRIINIGYFQCSENGQIKHWKSFVLAWSCRSILTCGFQISGGGPTALYLHFILKTNCNEWLKLIFCKCEMQEIVGK